MQFLKTLFWMLLAVAIAIFATRNWRDVTINLWGDLQADIKIPMLLLIMFLAGFLPALIYRARYRSLTRRQAALTVHSPPVAAEPEEEAR